MKTIMDMRLIAAWAARHEVGARNVGLRRGFEDPARSSGAARS